MYSASALNTQANLCGLERESKAIRSDAEINWMHATLRDIYSAEEGDRSPLPSFGGECA